MLYLGGTALHDQNVDALPVGVQLYKNAAARKLKAFQKFKEVGTPDNPITSADDSDLDAIKTALYNKEILAIGVYIGTWRLDTLKAAADPSVNQGVVGEQVVLNSESSQDGHAMTIVGYNDNIWTDLNGNDKIDPGEMGAFKIVNSWGPDYGNHGFIWMAYDSMNQVSCVEGAYNSPKRNRSICNVYRIEVMSPERTPHRFIEYTVNTDDRYHTKVVLSATWANQTISTSIEPASGSGNPYLAYDGTVGAKDADMAFDLDYFMDRLHADDISEVDWKLTVTSNEKNGHAITLKSCRIYDEQTGYVAQPAETLPFTVLNSEKTIQINMPSDNNAVIYYRGYQEPRVSYSLGSSMSEKELPMWYEDQEQYGYVYKCVVPLGNNSSATVKIGGKNSIWDDNNGKRFTVKKGDNFIVTDGVGEPLEFTMTHTLQDGQDLGTMDYFSAYPTGGYGPYKYKIVVKDKKTGEIEKDDDYRLMVTNGTILDLDYRPDYYRIAQVGYAYKKATTYQVTVYVMDAAGTVVSKSTEATLIDMPMRFEELSILNENTAYRCGEELQIYCRTINDQSNGGNCQCRLSILRDNRVIYTENPRAEYYGSGSDKTIHHTYHWTPTEGGEYTAIVSRTDANGEYACKSLRFTVAPSGLTLTQADFACEEPVPMGEAVKVTAKASGGDGSYQYQYSYVKYGRETVVSEYSANASGEILLPYETGVCQLVVTVKDGKGLTASASKLVQVVQPRIKSIEANKTEIQAQDSVTLSAVTKNAAKALTAAHYVYTASLNGEEMVLTTNEDKTASWKPAKAGTYTVRLTIRNGTEPMAVKSCQFTVVPRTQPLENKIRIGVIYYINDANSSSQFKLHYWNGSTNGDAACVSTGETANVSVGSAYWSGAAQKFYIYEATVPADTTGFKFHIGDRWFGTDGSVAASNAVYVFEYGGNDNALYRKE